MCEKQTNETMKTATKFVTCMRKMVEYIYICIYTAFKPTYHTEIHVKRVRNMYEYK